MPARFITWVIILFSLTMGAVLWWQFRGENQGQAAETMNVTIPGPTSSILVGHWTLDGNDVIWGDTSTEIKDVSGYAKHGNSSNLAAGSAVVGRIGQGLVFNGTNDSVSLGNVYNGVKTVAFWVKPNTTTQSVIDLNATATVDINAGTVRGNNFATPTVYVDGVATATFPDTGWHHIAITTATGINASAAYLGKIASNYLGGTLDDIRFYSNELSLIQVADLYRSSGAKQTVNFGMEGTMTDGLVGHWTMDGNDVIWGDTSSEVKDRSGNNNHGNSSGLTAASAVIGKLGQGLRFNGTSNEVAVASSASIDQQAKFSFCAWVYATGWGGGSEGTVGFKGYAPAGGKWYAYLLNSGSEASFAGACDAPTSSAWSKASNGSFSLNQWTFLCSTYDNVGDRKVRLYKNGSEVSYALQQPAVGTATTESGEEIHLGDEGYDASSFQGTIDDVRLYNRVLSGTEIANLYNVGK